MTTKTHSVHDLGQIVFEWMAASFPDDDLAHVMEIIGVYNDLLRGGVEDVERILRELSDLPMDDEPAPRKSAPKPAPIRREG